MFVVNCLNRDLREKLERHDHSFGHCLNYLPPGKARKNAFFSGSRHLWHAPCCERAKVSPQAKVGTSPFLNAALRTVWTDDVGALL